MLHWVPTKKEKIRGDDISHATGGSCYLPHEIHLEWSIGLTVIFTVVIADVVDGFSYVVTMVIMTIINNKLYGST